MTTPLPLHEIHGSALERVGPDARNTVPARHKLPERLHHRPDRRPSCFTYTTIVAKRQKGGGSIDASLTGPSRARTGHHISAVLYHRGNSNMHFSYLYGMGGRNKGLYYLANTASSGSGNGHRRIRERTARRLIHGKTGRKKGKVRNGSCIRLRHLHYLRDGFLRRFDSEARCWLANKI